MKKKLRNFKNGLDDFAKKKCAPFQFSLFVARKSQNLAHKTL